MRYDCSYIWLIIFYERDNYKLIRWLIHFLQPPTHIFISTKLGLDIFNFYKLVSFVTWNGWNTLNENPTQHKITLNHIAKQFYQIKSKSKLKNTQQDLIHQGPSSTSTSSGLYPTEQHLQALDPIHQGPRRVCTSHRLQRLLRCQRLDIQQLPECGDRRQLQHWDR